MFSVVFFSTFYPGLDIDLGIASVEDKGEDFLVTDLPFNNDPDKAFFAIFDGHGGKNVAQIAATSFETYFKDALSSQPSSVEQAFIEACHLFDSKLNQFCSSLYKKVGTTALSAYITRDNLYVANLGDSRALLVEEDGEIYQLSHDHKPDNADEKERIEKAGGFVLNLFGGVARVNGEIAVPRALGDFGYKEGDNMLIENTPEVLSHGLRPGSFFVLGSDGLWDALSNQEIVNFVETYFFNGLHAQTIAKALSSFAAQQRIKKGLGKDDITVIVAKIDKNYQANNHHKRYHVSSSGDGESFGSALKRRNTKSASMPVLSAIQSH